MTEEVTQAHDCTAEAIAQEIADSSPHGKRTDTYARIYQAAYLGAVKARTNHSGEGRSDNGWIVGNGDGTKWRTWGSIGPEWTDDREQATRYARRIDAERTHAEDDDAWSIVPFSGEGRRGAGEDAFQAEVSEWMLACFGEEIAADKIERADRFIEEALELAQTIPGFTVERALALVEYVFARPVGERGQEVGGVGVTLAALCNTYGLNIREEWQRELARVWTKVEAIRAKQASKPVGSALPTATLTPPPSDAMRETIYEELRRFAQNIFNGLDTGMITMDTPADETLANVLQRGRKALSALTSTEGEG